MSTSSSGLNWSQVDSKRSGNRHKYFQQQRYTHTHTHTHAHAHTDFPQYNLPQLYIPSIPEHTDMCMYNCDSSTIFQFVKKYGNVFSLDLGTFPSVLITGLPLIKEALVQQGENFSNRPVMPLQEHIFNTKGKFLRWLAYVWYSYGLRKVSPTIPGTKLLIRSLSARISLLKAPPQGTWQSQL